MTFAKRLDKLEERIAPPPAPVTFVLLEAPAGLTREEHAAWMKAHRGDGPVFTLDLGAASLARLHE